MRSIRRDFKSRPSQFRGGFFVAILLTFCSANVRSQPIFTSLQQFMRSGAQRLAKPLYWAIAGGPLWAATAYQLGALKSYDALLQLTPNASPAVDSFIRTELQRQGYADYQTVAIKNSSALSCWHELSDFSSVDTGNTRAILIKQHHLEGIARALIVEKSFSWLFSAQEKQDACAQLDLCRGFLGHEKIHLEKRHILKEMAVACSMPILTYGAGRLLSRLSARLLPTLSKKAHQFFARHALLENGLKTITSIPHLTLSFFACQAYKRHHEWQADAGVPDDARILAVMARVFNTMPTMKHEKTIQQLLPRLRAEYPDNAARAEAFSRRLAARGTKPN